MNNRLAESFRCEQGFTLLELLLALSIMTVLIILMFSAFQVGGRAWEKGEKLINAQQRLRVVPELIRGQVASLSTPELLKENDQWFFLRGGSKSLQFISGRSLYPANEAGNVYVNYSIVSENGKESLSFYEQDINEIAHEDLSEFNAGSYVDLLVEYTSITFSFLSEEEEAEDVWLSSWDSEVTPGVPKAIRLTLQKSKLDLPIIIVVPIMLVL